VGILIVLVIFAAIAYRVMTPEERKRRAETVIAAVRRGREASARRRQECEPFFAALRARTGLALVTPAIIVANVAVFAMMLLRGELDAQVAWGGNVGPLTANGEWWRLVSMMFVHTGIVQLLANIAGIVRMGPILERLVGRGPFALVYVTAGVFSGLVSLYTRPVVVSSGASGAILGLYGLLMTSSAWCLLQRSSLKVPLDAAKTLAAPAALFLLYNLATDSLSGQAELAGLMVGVAGGLALGKDIGEHAPPPRRAGIAATAAVVAALVCAVPLRGMIDVRPEVQALFALEDRTAGAYAADAEGFRRGRVTTEALLRTIERLIVPELQAKAEHLDTLRKVPAEHRPLLEASKAYLRLRQESWRLRAEGLRNTSLPAGGRRKGLERAAETSARRRIETDYMSNMRTLGKADTVERESLETLRRLGWSGRPPAKARG
jgi:membrane associated rhomboid family serine protease